MDFIFEKSKTIANKDDLVILFKKIRSSGSCCVTFYDELCKNMLCFFNPDPFIVSNLFL